MQSTKTWMFTDKLLFCLMACALPSNAQIDTSSSVIYKLSLNQAIDSVEKNHPLLKLANINTAAVKNYWLEAADMKSLDFNYRNGQLYSNTNDRYFETRLNFESVLMPFAKYEYKDKLQAFNLTEGDILKNKIIQKVKSSYFEYVYQINRLNLLNEQKDLLLYYFDFESDSTEKDKLDRIISETKLAQIENEANQAENDVLSAANELMTDAFIKVDIEPVDTILSMYEIRGSNDMKNRFPAKLQNAYYSEKIDLAKANLKIENAKLFPEISLGYFNQTIAGKSGFAGWEAAVSLPLWFGNRSKHNIAVAEQLKATEEFNYQDFVTKRQIENSLTELNKLFEKINYFLDFGLDQAEYLKKTAIEQFSTKDINFSKFIEGVTIAYQVKLDYIKTLNLYNQKAIELELFTY